MTRMAEPTRFAIPSFLFTPEYKGYQAEIEQRWERDKERERKLELLQQRSRRIAASPALTLTDRVQMLLVRDALEPTPALKAMRDWLGTPRHRPVIILSGGTGTGKSVAAAWFHVERGGVWLRAEQATRIFAANFGEQYAEQDRVRDARSLVIDDVGSELDVQRMQAVLLELFDCRKSSETDTVLTTNLCRRDFMERYGDERLISRMFELVHFVGCGKNDLRRSSQ
jgi:DNA replication protein DnaC